jgi:hypothetical protein
MYPSQKITLITVGSTMSLVALSLPAAAEPAGTAADLFPLNEQGMAADASWSQGKRVRANVSASVRPEADFRPAMLRAVAHTINTASGEDETEDPVDISDFVDLSFLEQFVDEEGNIDLPLGITVYEAMGTTSIGFGGDFR